MAQPIAKIEITMHEDGRVDVQGTGAILKHKAYAYGLLELAKEVLREGDKGGGVQRATIGEMPAGFPH
jgi:hypothetical protein